MITRFSFSGKYKYAAEAKAAMDEVCNTPERRRLARVGQELEDPRDGDGPKIDKLYTKIWKAMNKRIAERAAQLEQATTTEQPKPALRVKTRPAPRVKRVKMSNKKLTVKEELAAQNAKIDAAMEAVWKREPHLTKSQAYVKALHEDPQLYTDYLAIGTPKPDPKKVEMQRRIEEAVQKLADEYVRRGDDTYTATVKAWKQGGAQEAHRHLDD